MPTDAQLTPMMAQYRRIKSELPKDALLLFRLGDFYEMFFEDAQAGAQLLNVALTRRGGAPMCGIPFHAAASYISRLLRAGRKVAICDQMEEARPGQLVQREVTQILSPGAHFDERILSANRNNFLLAIHPLGGAFGLAAVDLTTGDFRVTELQGAAALASELERLRPAEVIYPSESADLANQLKTSPAHCQGYDDWVFSAETAQFTVRDHFHVASLDGFGLRNRPAAIGAAGAILHYLSQHLRRDVSHLAELAFYRSADYLILDANTLRHLEVLEAPREDPPRRASLRSALDRTITPMGARRWRDWLTRPLASIEPIRHRQEIIAAWIERGHLLAEFRAALEQVRDLERALGRLAGGSGNARDLAAIRSALEQIPAIRRLLNSLEDQTNARAAQQNSEGQLSDILPSPAPQSPRAELFLLGRWRERLREFPEIIDWIARGIVDEPPLALKEGGLIRDGFNPDLDQLRRAGREGKDWIAQLQQDEIQKTGIASLKVRFNSVFGYYIEITKANLDKTPPHYIRKQTVANGERFITPALKEMEGKILGAEERGIKLEYELYLQIRERVLEQLGPIQQAAQALAEADALASLAECARLFHYCRPEIGDEGVLRIEEGRHPALDQALMEERFVPNDAQLDLEKQQIALITGPNMAGKSTYIRQVALLALLAHTGSFIPASRARIDLIDRIFTRIGASDDLARGQSTFMVEMSETANILNNATRKSLIILDEIGRGTSTFDGLSLAWAIVEHLHNQTGAKTLFATHYHELTELGGRLERLRNFNVAVREWNDQVIFLRKILPGATDKSYGIQVARLAGVPKTVVKRAKEILANLEESELTPEGKPRLSRRRAEREKLQNLPPPPQLDLFASQ